MPMTGLRRRHNPYWLSDTEVAVMRLIVNGYTNPEIARLRVCAESTIRNHVVSLLRRMGVRNRVEAAATWVREQEQAR